MASAWQINTDGGARGNPGPAAVGVMIRNQAGKIIHRFGQTIGISTNNVAEYRAVIAALEWVMVQPEKPAALAFFLDSKLVAEQLNGRWKIKQPHLRELVLAVQELRSKLGGEISFTAIPREKNTQADFLVNQALDKC